MSIQLASGLLPKFMRKMSDKSFMFAACSILTWGPISKHITKCLRRLNLQLPWGPLPMHMIKYLVSYMYIMLQYALLSWGLNIIPNCLEMPEHSITMRSYLNIFHKMSGKVILEQLIKRSPPCVIITGHQIDSMLLKLWVPTIKCITECLENSGYSPSSSSMFEYRYHEVPCLGEWEQFW